MRMPADRRQLQAARRDQPADAARARRSGRAAWSLSRRAIMPRAWRIAAQRLGIAATIVMPSDAPAVKVEATRAQGAEIVFYDRAPRAARRSPRGSPPSSGATVVPCFDDAAHRRRAGQRRLEILEQLGAQRRRRIDRALRRRRPFGGDRAGLPGRRDRHASSPKAGTTWRRSLELGEIVPVGSRCAADAAATRSRPRWSRRSPSAFCKARGANGAGGQRGRGARRRCASPGASIGSSSSRAARSRSRRCSRARSEIVPEERWCVVSGGNVDPALHARIVG